MNISPSHANRQHKQDRDDWSEERQTFSSSASSPSQYCPYILLFYPKPSGAIKAAEIEGERTGEFSEQCQLTMWAEAQNPGPACDPWLSALCNRTWSYLCVLGKIIILFAMRSSIHEWFELFELTIRSFFM